VSGEVEVCARGSGSALGEAEICTQGPVCFTYHIRCPIGGMAGGMRVL
jgi:hypothetical protein